MDIFGFFKKDKKESASIAKQRLQVVIAKDQNSNPLLNVIEDDVIDAIKKYVNINPNNVETKLNEEEAIDILRVNAELEEKKPTEESSSLLDVLFSRKKKSASIAKERLQIIIARDSNAPDFSDKLEKDIKGIVKKYTRISPDNISIVLDYDSDGIEFLELNITLPDEITNNN